jgi:hypothetical protein
MNLSDLTAATAWIRDLDADADFQIERGALWVVFSASAEQFPQTVDCITIDVIVAGNWRSWIDCTDDEIADADLFRWIVMVE